MIDSQLNSERIGGICGLSEPISSDASTEGVQNNQRTGRSDSNDLIDQK